MKTTSLLLAMGLAMVGGCGGDDPLTYSAPVGINLKAKSDDVKSGVVQAEKGITTEQGNPFGAFVKDARARLGGVDPALVTISSLTLTLGAASKGVTTLEEVFSGDVEALLLMDSTKNTVKAGQVTDPRGSGPVNLAILFDDAAMGAADRQEFLGASFKVVLRGAAAASFDTKKAEVDLQLTFHFEAFDAR